MWNVMRDIDYTIEARQEIETHIDNENNDLEVLDHCTFCFNNLGDYKQNCLQSEKVYNETPEWLKDTDGVRIYIGRIMEMTDEERKKMFFDKQCWEAIQKCVKNYGKGATDNEVH